MRNDFPLFLTRSRILFSLYYFCKLPCAKLSCEHKRNPCQASVQDKLSREPPKLTSCASGNPCTRRTTGYGRWLSLLITSEASNKVATAKMLYDFCKCEAPIRKNSRSCSYMLTSERDMQHSLREIKNKALIWITHQHFSFDHLFFSVKKRWS